jgi:hypothetical protein
VVLTMSTLIVGGHVYCRECSAPVPEGWLGCPQCAGFVKIKGHWAPPSELQPKAQPQQEQPSLFVFEAQQEYPA